MAKEAGLTYPELVATFVIDNSTTGAAADLQELQRGLNGLVGKLQADDRSRANLSICLGTAGAPASVSEPISLEKFEVPQLAQGGERQMVDALAGAASVLTNWRRQKSTMETAYLPPLLIVIPGGEPTEDPAGWAEFEASFRPMHDLELAVFVIGNSQISQNGPYEGLTFREVRRFRDGAFAVMTDWLGDLILQLVNTPLEDATLAGSPLASTETWSDDTPAPDAPHVH